MTTVDQAFQQGLGGDAMVTCSCGEILWRDEALDCATRHGLPTMCPCGDIHWPLAAAPANARMAYPGRNTMMVLSSMDDPTIQVGRGVWYWDRPGYTGCCGTWIS